MYTKTSKIKIHSLLLRGDGYLLSLPSPAPSPSPPLSFLLLPHSRKNSNRQRRRSSPSRSVCVCVCLCLRRPLPTCLWLLGLGGINHKHRSLGQHMHTLACWKMRAVPLSQVHECDVVLSCDVLNFFAGVDGVVVSL